MTEKELLKKSGFYTSFILFLVSLFWFLFSIQTSFGGYTGGPASGIDVGINSRSTAQANWQVGSSGVYVLRLGIENVIGSGSAGYMTGTNTYYPRIEWTPTLGTFNFVGTGSYPVTVQMNGVAIPSAGSVSGKINAVQGTGTSNVLTDTTLAGLGTITASFGANGLVISPTEYSAVNNATGELQAQITTATGSITNHTHTGNDGTTQVSHTNLTNKGTQTHTQIDDFIASKAAASGIASLDGSSLVVQNPANATNSPAASKIPIALGTGKLNDSWLSDNVTKLGTPTTSNISEGSNLYHTAARVNSLIGSSSITSPQVSPKITFISPAIGQFLKIVDTQGNVENGTSSVSVDFPAVIGSASASQLPLISGLLGSATSAQLPPIIELPATTTTITGTSAVGRWYNLQDTCFANNPDSYTELLLHMNNIGTSTFVDSSASAHTITANGNAIGTSTARFGISGGGFDGAGDYLSIADSADWDILAGNFTIDLWVKRNDVSGDEELICHFQDGSNFYMIQDSPGSSLLKFHISSGGTVEASTTNLGDTEWHHVAVVKSGTTIKIYKDGVAGITTTNSTAAFNGTFYIGIRNGTTNPFYGSIDELRISKGIAHWTSNFTPPTREYFAGTYTFNSLQYIPPGTTTPSLLIVDDGTNTTDVYMLANVTTAIFGLGTITAVTGTSAVYNGWFDGAVRATAFNVASTEKIKENIKPITIKPDLLDAEGMAKLNYIANNKIAWIAEHGGSYTTVVNETGTGSVIVVDTDRMESDYNNYIELEWSADINQDIYTENIQKTHEKGFWQMFDSITPKSWNPRDKPSLTRKGFVVEDMPDVVKGDDGQSIDPMALIAYMAKVSQSLKADTIFALSTLQELITTGTVTQQKIDYANDRLEILNY